MEGLGGHCLNYQGCVTLDITLSDINKQVEALFLVVLNTTYHEHVPLLIGTIVLHIPLHLVSPKRCPSDAWHLDFCGPTELSKLKLTSCLGQCRTTKPLTVPPNFRTLIKHLTRIRSCMQLTVLMEEFSVCALIGSLRLSPCLSSVQPHRNSHRMPVEVTNYSLHSVAIPAKMFIRST